MNKFYRRAGAVLLILTLVFGLCPAVYCEEYLFYDDFDEMPEREYLAFNTANLVNTNGVMTRTGGRLRMERSAGVAEQYPVFAIPAAYIGATASEKVVIEYKAASINSLSGGHIRPRLGNVNLTSNAANGQTPGVHYIIYNRAAGSAQLFIPGKNVIEVTGLTSGLSSSFAFGFQAQIVAAGRYHEFDYIKIYELNDSVTLAKAETAEPDEVLINISGAIVQEGINPADYITVDNATVSEAVYDEDIPGYRVQFSHPLDYDTRYTLNINGLPCLGGNLLITKELEFKTRPRERFVSIMLKDGNFRTGAQALEIDVKNEFSESMDALLLACLYDKDKMLKSISDFPLTIETAHYNETLKLPQTSDSDTLELFVVDSLAKMNQIGTKTVYSPEGTELFAYTPASEVRQSEMIKIFNTDDLKVDFTVSLPRDAGDRHANLVVLKKNISPSELCVGNILYMAQKETFEGDAVFSVKMPDETADYNVLWWTDGEPLSAEGFRFYNRAFIDEGLAAFNLAKNAAEIENAMNKYKDAAGLIIPPGAQRLSEIWTSVVALRHEGGGAFTGIAEVQKAINTAGFIVLKENGDTAGFIEKFHREYGFDEGVYEVYTEKITAAARADVLKYMKGTATPDIAAVRNCFARAVIIYGIYHVENYTQARLVINTLYGVIGLDMRAYNALSSTYSVDAGIAGRLFSSYFEIISVFNSLVASAGGGGGSGKKSSGGGTSVFTPLATPAPQIKTPEPPKPGQVLTEQSDENRKFSDITGYEWAAEAIYHFAEENILHGKAEGLFCPGDTITRGEAAKILSLALGLDYGGFTSFSDVREGHWCYGYVTAVFENEIMIGISESLFGVNSPLTREMLATALYRSLKAPEKEENTETVFIDIDDASDYARQAVTYLGGVGLVNGVGGGLFAPKKPCTRAEAVKMIYSFIQYSKLRQEV